MEPPVHLRVVSRRDHLLGLLARAAPAILFVVGATVALVILGRRHEEIPTEAVWPMCGLSCFGLASIGALLPTLWQRLVGLSELRSASADVTSSNREIEAGRPARAAEILDATAGRIAGKLPAYHVVVVAAAAVAHALAGQIDLGLGVLLAVERSGWLESFALRLHRDGIASSIAALRAIAGDVEGAERALRLVRGARVPDAVAAARVVVAVRRADDDARARVAELLASGAIPTVRGRVTLLALAGVLAAAAGDTSEDARRAAELAALRPRIFAHYRAGWPEVKAWLERHGIADAALG